MGNEQDFKLKHSQKMLNDGRIFWEDEELVLNLVLNLFEGRTLIEYSNGSESRREK